jgi:hypothetical protein
MKIVVAATLLAASLAGMAAPTHASTDVAPVSYSYRVDDPPPPDPSREEAPAPPADCTMDNPDPACHPPPPHYHRGHGILIQPGVFERLCPDNTGGGSVSAATCNQVTEPRC